MRGITEVMQLFVYLINSNKEKTDQKIYIIVMKVSKENGIPPGFEPETSGLLDRRSTD